MQFDIDIAMFLVFLALNLAVGLYYGRGVKTIRDYALGGRNFSTGSLVATIVATVATGSMFIIGLERTYSDGLYDLIPTIGLAISFLFVAIFFVPKMGEFLGKISIAEAMGDLYGKYARIITATAGIIGAAGVIAVQYKAFGNIFSYFLGFPSVWAVILAGSIVTIYSAFGGIRAVTFTDILQFVTFFIALPLIGMIIWDELRSIEEFNFTKVLQDPKFDFEQVLNFGNPEFWQMLALMLYFITNGISPVYFQRISMGRNILQVQKAFIIAAVLLIFIILAIAWIPFLILNINPNLDSTQLFSYIIDHYSYAGLKGLLIIAITAMAMSSADSFINTSSVLFANDLCQPLNVGKGKELFLSKIFAIALGSSAIALALSKQDLLSILLAANRFYIPIVTAPLMLAILGFRSTAISALIGMGAGFTTVILWRILDIQQADCIIPGMLINLIFLMGSHYLLKQPGGWINKTNTPPIPYSERLKLFYQKKNAQSLAFIKSLRYIKFCQRYAPANELTYMWVGIYFIVYTFFTMYSTHVELVKDSTKTILFCYQLMMVSGTTMAMYPIWPLSVPQYIKEAIIKFLWFIEIFYMFGFFSTFFVLLSNFGAIQTSLFTINAVAAVVVTGVRIGLTLLVAGFYSGICFYKYYTGIEILDTSFGSPYFVFTYSALFMSAALAMFFIPKEKQQALLAAKNVHLNDRIDYQKHEAKKALELKNEFLRNIEHESRTPITGITSMGQILYEGYDKLTEQQRRKGLKDIVNSSARLDSFVNNLVDLSKISNLTYELNRTMVDLSKLVYNRLTLCKKLYVNDKKELEFIPEIENNIILNCDEYYISAVLDNLIMNAIQYSKKQGRITVKLHRDNSTSTIHFIIKDEGIGIPKEELTDIFGAFVVSSKTHTPAGGRGVGLALCKKAIELHNGTITADSDGENGSTFEFILPEVRS